MAFAIKKYQVDLVIGNILNRKEEIYIEYNELVFPKISEEYLKGNV
jgi:hypothetical protein